MNDNKKRNFSISYRLNLEKIIQEKTISKILLGNNVLFK